MNTQTTLNEKAYAAESKFFLVITSCFFFTLAPLMASARLDGRRIRSGSATRNSICLELVAFGATRTSADAYDSSSVAPGTSSNKRRAGFVSTTDGGGGGAAAAERIDPAGSGGLPELPEDPSP